MSGQTYWIGVAVLVEIHACAAGFARQAENAVAGIGIDPALRRFPTRRRRPSHPDQENNSPEQTQTHPIHPIPIHGHVSPCTTHVKILSRQEKILRPQMNAD
jgi:hypothetical protein